MNLHFTGKIFYWRGHAPFFFVTVPEDQSAEIKAVANLVTYGWGVIPVIGQIGQTEFKTSSSLSKAAISSRSKMQLRAAENLDLDDEVTIHLKIQM